MDKKLFYIALAYLLKATIAQAQGDFIPPEGDFIISDFEGLLVEVDTFYDGRDEAGGFISGVTFFPNEYDASLGNFWQGWSYTNISDTIDQTLFNQFAANTGVGVDPESSGGSTYVTSYSLSTSTILFTDSLPHEVAGFFVTNSSFATGSMENGDFFAKKFGGDKGNDPDFFLLSIWGFSNNVSTDTVEFYLADYRFEDNTQDYIVKNWEWIDLSSLGSVDSLKFGLSSSDVGLFGMNTPAYFCADNLWVEDLTTPLILNTISLDTTETALYPNPSNTGDLKIRLTSQTIEAHVSIVSMQGQLIHQYPNYRSEEIIDMSRQPAGTYVVTVRQANQVETRIFIKQ